MPKPQDNQAEIREILNSYEVGLVEAGVDASSVDYDKLSDLRQKTWTDLEALLARREAEASEYQIGVALCNEKLGFWGLSIAKGGRQVYGNVFRTEQEARDAIPEALAALNQHTPKEG